MTDAKGTHIGRLDAKRTPNGRQTDAKCRSGLQHLGVIALAGFETPAYLLSVPYYVTTLIRPIGSRKSWRVSVRP